MNRYILFEVAGATFGIPTGVVRHIEMVEHITIVPNANPAIDGVVFSRGQVIPALSLRTRFGYPRVAHTLRTRLIFVEFQERTVGLVVDAAREFVSLGSEVVRPIEQALTGINGNFLKGVANVGGRLILLVDLEAVLDLDQYEPAPADLTDPTPPVPLASSATASPV